MHDRRRGRWAARAAAAILAMVGVAACVGSNDADDATSSTVASTQAEPADTATTNTQQTTAVPTTAAPTDDASTTETSATTPDVEPAGETVTVLAAADLTDCRGPDIEVAELIRSLDGTILMPGDISNLQGTAEQYEECFDPIYGSELDRIYAVPGDNDYNTPGAGPYFDLMASRPGERGKGWYAVELGEWQLIALNSNCDDVGGCREDSEQYAWLDALLQEERVECRIIMWHEPRFTSAANYRGIPRLGDFYGRVHGSGADILIVGHSHTYERLGPLAPNGDPDPDGIMNFTVGIGGAFFTEFGEPRPGSEIRSNEHRGVVRFTLRPDGYDWEFINVPSNPSELVDSGSASC